MHKHLVVASTNPVKARAALCGFERMFPDDSFDIHTVSVPSGVSDQPATDTETLQGAFNRACAAYLAHPQGDYWIGIEGGIEDFPSGMAAFAWVVVYTPGFTGQARTGAFFLPPAVTALVHQGKELGEADDIVFGQSNSKQANGAIGLLTNDVVDRAEFYQQAVILSLVGFRNPQLYY